MSNAETRRSRSSPKIDEIPDHVIIQSIRPKNLLSFGETSEAIELKQLNVLIGPNGSGKSNFIAALSLISNTPGNLGSEFLLGGGASEWIHKGGKESTAAISVRFRHLNFRDKSYIHSFAFSADGPYHALTRESIVQIAAGTNTTDFVHYINGGNRPQLYSNGIQRHVDIRQETSASSSPNESISSSSSSASSNQSDYQYPNALTPSFDLNRSILGQIHDPINYVVPAYLTAVYQNIMIYRDFTFGPGSNFRRPQATDVFGGRVSSNGDNLNAFLSRIRVDSQSTTRILYEMRNLYDGVSDFLTLIEGGGIRLFLKEGDHSFPASRLSDGTLRYLFLVAILCDPNPPTVICIEEPELGLHPDVIPSLAKLMLKASERTQLIITTHSDQLVDCFSNHPEYVMVCEKHDGQTQIKRLDPEALKVWLKEYSLGNLWTSGQIGGNRW